MPVTDPALQFLAGGGEVGSQLRSMDWRKTQIGAPAQWPSGLKTTMSIILNARAPMVVFWGPEHLCFFNDAYLDLIAEQREHLRALAQRGEDHWRHWPAIKSRIDRISTNGEATRKEDEISAIFLNEKTEKEGWSAACSAIADGSGKPAGFLITVAKIPAQLNSGKQADTAETFLRMAAESAEIGAWELDLETNQVTYSSRVAQIFGQDTAKVLSFNDFKGQIHPDDISQVREKAVGITVQKGTYFQEARIIHPDRTIHWIRVQGNVVFDSDHRPVRVLGVIMDITSQQEASRKVAQLAAIVKSSHDAIISKDLDGIITSWNDSAQRIFGYTPEEMIGRSVTSLIPPDRIEEEPKILSRLRQGEMVDHFETKRVTKGGQILDVSLSISPVRSRTGHIVGASKIVRDITIQKEAERQLRESEERLKIVIDASELGTWELNLLTNELSYSQRHLEMLGYAGLTQIPYQELVKRLHPEDLSTRQKAFETAYRTGFLHYVTRVILSDNATKWIEAKGKVFYDDLHRPVRIIGTSRDLTAEKTFQKELQENEQKFRTLADAMPQFVWTSNAQGQLNYFNQAVSVYSGLTMDALTQGQWLQVIHPDEREENLRLWKHSTESGTPFLLEHRFRRHDGEYRWQLSRAIPQKDDEGNIQMWIGTSTDIHDQKVFRTSLESKVQQRTQELKKANDDLIKINHELAQFAYVASHDLQEPLRKIQTFASRILEVERQHLSPRGQDYFSRMQAASVHMQQLITDLLAYSRTNTAEKYFEPTDLNKLVSTVKEHLREPIEHKRASVTYSNLPTMNVIPFQFEQILNNLISNSLKFSREGTPPEISIKASLVKGDEVHVSGINKKGTYHLIVVKDNGIGFEPQFSERIFQVFQRLHGKEEYAGTGIGLAIVRKSVENHHGVVTATGEPGKGATFNLYFPAADAS